MDDMGYEWWNTDFDEYAGVSGLIDKNHSKADVAVNFGVSRLDILPIKLLMEYRQH